jgi:hypothetical protein
MLGDSYAIQGQILAVLNRSAESQAATGKLIAISEEFVRANPDN